jgi:hypothetical protein
MHGLEHGHVPVTLLLLLLLQVVPLLVVETRKEVDEVSGQQPGSKQSANVAAAPSLF